MDDSAMADVPMKLLISAVLTSLLVPMVMGGFDDLSCSVAEDRALREMKKIATAARTVMDGDVGSTITIELDLEGFGTAGFRRGTIGGPLTGPEAGYSYIIVFHLDVLGRISIAPDPPVRMTTTEGEGLGLVPGKVTLEVTHGIVEGMHAASFGYA